jgi:hypothetical protein
MRKCVIAQVMAGSEDGIENVGRAINAASHHEKHGLCTVGFKPIENGRRYRRVWSIVKRQQNGRRVAQPTLPCPEPIEPALENLE